MIPRHYHSHLIQTTIEFRGQPIMNQLMNSVHVSMRPATNSSQFVIGITGIQRKNMRVPDNSQTNDIHMLQQLLSCKETANYSSLTQQQLARH